MSKTAWKKIPVTDHVIYKSGGNYVLKNDKLLISYQPWDSENDGRNVMEDLATLITGDDRKQPETALYDGKVWRILWGDHRKEYEQAFPSMKKCLKVYERLKPEFGCDKWSTD